MTHDCVFDEVLVEDSDWTGPLRAGMKVLTPCPCGETPLDHLGVLEMHAQESAAALLSSDPRRALYHWSPAARRKQILRYGLRPHARPVTSSTRSPCICFGDSPSWAWALSGQQRGAPQGQWDLWETALDLLEEPVVLPSTDRSSGIHEVRTVIRVPKSKLWHVASREKL